MEYALAVVCSGPLLLGFRVEAEENKKTYNLTTYLASFESCFEKWMNKQPLPALQLSELSGARV